MYSNSRIACKASAEKVMVKVYDRVLALLREMNRRSPAGYAIAAEIEFTTPAFLFQFYPDAWLAEYSERGFVMKDPTVQWGFQNGGVIDWLDLAPLDTAGLFRFAADHGLGHGFTVSQVNDGFRSIASYSRGDHQFSASEKDHLAALLGELVGHLGQVRRTDPALADRIRNISVALTRG